MAKFKKSKKIKKKYLTTSQYHSIIDKLTKNRRLEKNLKIFQKNMKKGIDKTPEVWYNTRAVAKAGARKLVIEN